MRKTKVCVNVVFLHLVFMYLMRQVSKGNEMAGQNHDGTLRQNLVCYVRRKVQRFIEVIVAVNPAQNGPHLRDIFVTTSKKRYWLGPDFKSKSHGL